MTRGIHRWSTDSESMHGSAAVGSSALYCPQPPAQNHSQTCSSLLRLQDGRQATTRMSSSDAALAPSAAPPVLRIRPPPSWTPEEDARLERLAREHGARHWRRVASSLLTGRSSRQCRDRWRHHLAHDVYHRPFTARDDDDLARLYVRHAGRWRDISRAVRSRTSRVMRRRWRELRDSEAFLRKLWRPRPPHQDALGPGTESSSQQPLTFTCVGIVC